MVMAAEMLVNAILLEKLYGNSIPYFGFERRGAPVAAFVRFDDKPIREKTQIYYPDCLVVLDATQRNSALIYEGLKPGGVLILNSSKTIEKKPHDNVKLAGVVNADAIAMEELGRASPNTCVLGAFAAATRWIGLDYIYSSLEQYFSGEIFDRNMRTAERGFNEVRVTTW